MTPDVLADRVMALACAGRYVECRTLVIETIAAAVAEEREACAKLVVGYYCGAEDGEAADLTDLAATIRARGANGTT